MIPDTHVPFHDKKAWELTLRVVKGWEPDKVVFIGDFGDCWCVSEHDKDPERKLSLVDEVDAVNVELDRVEDLVGDKAVFIEGNHEDRLRRYLWKQAKELFGTIDIPKLYRTRERGWRHVKYRDYYRLGPVTYVHDLGRSGIYAARQTLMDYGGNIVFGHTHRGGIYYQGESKGSTHFSLNVGWLGDVNAIDYMHKAKATRDWQLGFGTVVHESPKMAFAQFHPIIRGKVEVGGKIYT